MNPRTQDLADLHAQTAPAALLDRQYRILASNERYQEAFHRQQDGAGLHCYQSSHGFDRPCDEAGECCPLKMSAESGVAEQMLHIHQLAQGKEFVLVEITPLFDERGRLLYFRELQQRTLIASAEPRAQGLVGVSPPFIQMLDDVHKVARSAVPVLLLGESGTGKELIARALHDASDRAARPFVAVECSGLTETLFESELFGHRKGSFTGALADKPGLIEAVQGGTLFLDEIGDVPLGLQVKLLRLLESHSYRKVGETQTRQADFRLVCATHRDLDRMMAEGAFRTDLYYRISTFPIRLPPLRERPQDIRLLAQSVLLRSHPERRLELSDPAAALLEAYAFPGNIRELVNLLERARILCSGHSLLPVHFPALCASNGDGPSSDNPGLPCAASGPAASGQASTEARLDTALEASSDRVLSLKEVERLYLQRLLLSYPKGRAELALELGISLRTLNRKIAGL
ncbi:MAG: sigma 54-interacting transcriptional regulator [Gammaproteobacteria bacterium SHHR-1]|uniref:sigma-54 interaction domain-containing protein n=1 Tax=Magnetovirga frankeli TaxID=947516 RepID=UPI00129361ED|nr:sigma 54-interacting transcriptional regulator [gamma proteobacterium SS-5]